MIQYKPYDLVFLKDFRSLSYGNYIRQYILQDNRISDNDLINIILQHADEKPNLTELANLLNETLHLNAGVTPILFTEKESYIIAGQSQRTGKQTRGVVVNAMGKTEKEDITLADTAIREMYEELGPYIGNHFSKNIGLSHCLIKNRLGTSIEEVSQNICNYLLKKRRSISLSATLIIPSQLSESSLQSLISKTNKLMGKLGEKYLDMVAIRYPENDAPPNIQPEHFNSFIIFAEEVLCDLPEAIKAHIIPIIEKLKRNHPKQDSKDILALLDGLIDVSENSRVILTTTRHVETLCQAAAISKTNLILGKTCEDEPVEYFVPCLKDVSLFFAQENQACLQLMKEQVSSRSTTSYHRLLSEIGHNPPNNDLKPEKSNELINYAVDIASSLLTATRYHNPRGLTAEAHQALSLGDIYHEHVQKAGVFLKDVEIPSHVAAAKTDERVALINCKRGTKLFQFVRPGGYIGDYYAGKETDIPELLGASSKVSDPNNPKLEADRVKLTFIVINKDGFASRVSTAKAVDDFWSINGRTIKCPGGGEQYYMPTTLDDKKQGLFILAPSDKSQLSDVEAIAKRNNLQFVTEQELKQKHGISILNKPYSRKQNLLPGNKINLEEQLQLAFSAWKFGNYNSAYDYLDLAYDKMPAQSARKAVISCLLACFSGHIGQVGRAVKLFNEFLDFYNQCQDNEFKKKFAELVRLAKYQLATLEPSPVIAIHHLSQLSSSALLQLDIGIRYNQLASQYSDEITYHDFNEHGERCDTKLNFAREAEAHLLDAINRNELSIQERLIAMIELSQAYHKQRKNKEALE